MISLSDAIDAAVAHTEVVSSAREDKIVSNLIKAYLKAPWAQFDAEAISEELSELSASVTFDTKAFPLDGTRGIKTARNARIELQAIRDRLVSLDRSLREGLSKTAKVLRVGLVYLRKSDVFKEKTAKHLDAIAEVCLREIVENQETMKLLLDEVKETLSTIDSKAKVLDSWFSLHKQYVFMTGMSRGPRGEQETYDASERQSFRKRS